MLETLFSMKDKTCVVTGGSRGLGFSMTRNLASLLANDNIRVNAIAPGRFFSKMTEYASQDEEGYKKEIEMIPLHRWGGEVDIAGIAVMLASPAGGFMTGQSIVVDGGMTVVR